MDYLLCQYGPGLFSTQRTATFQNDLGESCSLFVLPEDILPLEGNQGLLRTRACWSEGPISHVRINDLLEQRWEYFRVPTSTVTQASPLPRNPNA